MKKVLVFVKLLLVFCVFNAYADSLDAVDDLYITPAGTSLTCYVLLNDSESIAGTIVIDSFDSVSVHGGTISDNGDGTLQFVPAGGFMGLDSFTYTATDAGSGYDTATVRVNVNAVFDVESARDQILNGVSSLGDPGGPGWMVAYGKTAYSIGNYDGNDHREPMIAAASLGQGRVLAMPDHQWLEMNSLGPVADTGQYYLNSLEWLAGTSSKTIKIVVTPDTSAVSWLTGEDFTDVVQSSNYATELADADVLVGWLGSNVSQSNLDIIADFVRNGGGLFICDYGIGYEWWWSPTVPNAPGNLLLRHAGIGFTSEWPGGSLIVDRATGQTTSEDVIGMLDDSSGYTLTELDIGAKVLDRMFQVLNEGDSLLARLDEKFYERIESINPTPATPVDDAFEKALLRRESTILADTPVDEIIAHRTAEGVYGYIPPDAPRITQTISYNVAEEGKDIRGNDSVIWLSTGLYAVPGEIVTVTVDPAVTGLGLKVKINGDWNNISERSSYLRMPFGTSREFDINTETIQTANAFGGLLYIVVPRDVVPGSFNAEFGNVIEAPYFVLGVDTNEDWISELRDKPGPWAEMVSDNVIITLSCDKIRDLDYAEELMTFWNEGTAAQDDLAGLVGKRTRPSRMYSMIQTAWGGGYAGYPIGAWDWDFGDYEAKENGDCWGEYHELGHLHQSGYWTDGRTGEVTVNVFTMRAIEAVCDSGRASGGWGLQWDPAARVDMYQDVLVLGGFDMAGLGERLVMYSQLKTAFGWDAFKGTYQTYFDDEQSAPGELPTTDQEEWDQWMTRLSNEVGYDLSPFFIDWDYGVSQTAINSLSGLSQWNMVETVPDEILTNPNTSVVLPDVGANDFSFDGILNLVSIENPNNGTLQDNGDGTYTYIPDEGFDGTDTFAYTVENGFGNNFSSTITVKIRTLETGLVAHWPFNANALDYSANVNDGTLNNGPAFAGGIIGQALTLDGSNDYVTFGVGPALSGKTDFTISAWVQTSTTSSGVIIQQRNGGFNGEYRCNVNSDGTLGFMLYGNSAYQFDFSTTESVNDGNWHHVVFIRQGDNGYIYIDGSQAASASGTARDLSSSIGVGIGADIRDYNSYFNGMIDDAAVWDRALEDNEISYIRRNGLSGKTFRRQYDGSKGMEDFVGFAQQWLDTDCRFCDGADLTGDENVNIEDMALFVENWLSYFIPTAYWTFDDGVGDTALDSSVNELHGTLVNMDDSDWVAGYYDGALEFDGTDDHVDIIGYKGITGTSARTCSAWIKTTVATGDICIMSWGANGTGQAWRLNVSDSVPAVRVYSGYVKGSANIADGQWHHVAVVLDADSNISQARFYVDGIEDTISDTTDVGVNTGGEFDMQIGSDEFDVPWYFNGMIDEVKIYDRAFDADEIANF